MLVNESVANSEPLQPPVFFGCASEEELLLDIDESTLTDDDSSGVEALDCSLLSCGSGIFELSLDACSSELA